MDNFLSSIPVSFPINIPDLPGIPVPGLPSSSYPVKAALKIIGRSTLQCYFNPTEYGLSTTSNWSKNANAALDAPHYTFGGRGDTTMSLELLFDTMDSGANVAGVTSVLWDSVRRVNSLNNSEPPHVIFTWGEFNREAVVKSLSQKFVLFREDGSPIRSIVNIELLLVDEKEFLGQNPTSSGLANNQIHIWREGDRIDLVAAKYTGRATAWREIARHNNIDKPRSIEAGTVLLIPPHLT